MILGIPVGYAITYNKIISLLYIDKEKITFDVSSLVALSLKNIFISVIIINLIILFMFYLFEKFKGKFKIFKLFIILMLFLIGVCLFKVPFENKTNAFLINDDQIVLLVTSNKSVVIKPILQTSNFENVDENYMKYEWFILNNSDGFFNQSIAAQGTGIIFDTKEVKINDIVFGWSSHQAHSGYIYPSGINNFETKIKVIITDENNIRTQKIRDIVENPK
jgi:hypothetical protein